MPLDVELLQSSFEHVTANAGEFADRFFDRLFRETPHIKTSFKTPLDQQKKYLIAALAFVVANLENPVELAEAVSNVGIRRIGYGVKREDYPIVGQTLLKTLAEVTGPRWTQATERAWAQAYCAIQGIIFRALDQQASYSASAQNARQASPAA